MARFSIPTTARLPSSLRVGSSSPILLKSLIRLSREALISLAIDWLNEDVVANARPYLRIREHGEDEDEDDPDEIHPPCQSITELLQLYVDMQQQKGSKRDVANRILEGDWRHGLTLYQLAMLDFCYLDEHPASQKWTAYRILPLKAPSMNTEEDALKADHKSLSIPRFHPSTFLQNLQIQVLPDVKAHYHFYRPKNFPVLLLRVFVIESPYNTALALSNPGNHGAAAQLTASRTIYLAFPDGSPNIFITKSQTTGPVAVGEARSLHNLIISGIPQALSRPRERYTLKSTSLTSRNLEALLDKKGPGRGSAAGGGWSIYADEKNKKSPLDTVLPTPPLSAEELHSGQNLKRQLPLHTVSHPTKRTKLVAMARFGLSAIITDGKGVERIDILLQDPFPAYDGQSSDDESTSSAPQKQAGRRRRAIDATLEQTTNADEEGRDAQDDSSQWRPAVKVTFQGSHVFAGIRQLVEAGIVDGQRMPSWMTGEDGVTSGVVRNGRIKGHKGSGF